MKKLIPNPAFDAARYELVFQMTDGKQVGPVAHRFDSLPSDEVFKNHKLFWKWVQEHSIPEFITTPTGSHA